MAYTTIDDPSAHFQVKTYSGNSTQTAITFDGSSNLQPDLIWAKSRSNAHYHDWRDTSRGLTKRLYTNGANEEDTKSASYVSFDSNGFTLGDDQQGGSNANTVNSSSNNYVSWCWKANGGTTSSNSDGDITTTVQTDSTAGFSIITYTGNGNNLDTIGHGLGATPDFAVVKGRSASSNTKRWFVKIPAVCGNSEILEWDTTNGKQDSGNGIETMGSSTITLGIDTGNANSTNESSETYVCYAWKNIQGYSKIGSYTGNGNADGPFVYTGFKPAWVMIKSSGSNGDNWVICDNKRDTFNVMENILLPNSANAEFDETSFDFLSNGFKLRQNAATYNDNNDTFVYMAFAEHPFVSSKGVPVTAR
jgi:hypothetical protein